MLNKTTTDINISVVNIIQCSYIIFLFSKTISLFYSLFVFRLSYKITVLSSLNLAGRELAGLPVFGPRVWAGYGPETCRPGRAWAKHSQSGSGLGRA